ncbi:hypothetical protein AKO1_015757 [Acrasis kona]|uniref:Uncharacterized protein n=1 Tax=Acrasis kona TaxID=1008807 RepID=A0AAW2ZGQ1_9EUKA
MMQQQAYAILSISPVTNAPGYLSELWLYYSEQSFLYSSLLIHSDNSRNLVIQMQSSSLTTKSSTCNFVFSVEYQMRLYVTNTSNTMVPRIDLLSKAGAILCSLTLPAIQEETPSFLSDKCNVILSQSNLILPNNTSQRKLSDSTTELKLMSINVTSVGVICQQDYCGNKNTTLTGSSDHTGTNGLYIVGISLLCLFVFIFIVAITVSIVVIVISKKRMKVNPFIPEEKPISTSFELDDYE